MMNIMFAQQWISAALAPLKGSLVALTDHVAINDALPGLQVNDPSVVRGGNTMQVQSYMGVSRLPSGQKRC